MNKIWLASYPRGIPAEINPDEWPSLVAMLEHACARFADLPAFASMGAMITYRQYDEYSRHFAAWLQTVAKLQRGDRMAIMLPNVLQYPIALFGALRAGVTVVNTNPLYTARELEHQLVDSEAKVVLILENFAHTLEGVIAHTKVETVIVTGVGDLLGIGKAQITNAVVRYVRKQVPAWRLPGHVRFKTALRQGRFHPAQPVALNHDDIAFLQYTGGTTGVAKGAMLTHRNMVANVLQSCAWMGADTKPGTEIAITALPLYHIFALEGNWLAQAHIGALNVLIVNPRDFPAFVKELGKYRFTFFSGVNTLFNALMHTPGFAQLDFSSLRTTIGGGMAVQQAIADKWQSITGNVLTQGWGLTETSPAACVNPVTATAFTGAIGLPLPSTDITIRDDGGRILGIGEVGEICVQGPQVMRGYWRRDDETALVMLPDGALRTGDIGRMDEQGYVFIEDRKKDMILVSGFNVYPNEVESVVAMHPGVLEVAAVAQADEHSGEVVALFVVRKDPALTQKDLIDFCRERLTGYKVPRHVYFRNDLPKTNVGKILRRQLRDELNARGARG